MTEGRTRGKWLRVRKNGEFEIAEFELAGSNCTNYFSLYNSDLIIDPPYVFGRRFVIYFFVKYSMSFCEMFMALLCSVLPS